MSRQVDMRSIDIRRRPRRDGTELVTYRVRWTAPDGKREARSFDELVVVPGEVGGAADRWPAAEA